MNCLTVGREEVGEVGLALCQNDLIRKISFTGSTDVGKWLMRESASTVKRVGYLFQTWWNCNRTFCTNGQIHFIFLLARSILVDFYGAWWKRPLYCIRWYVCD